MVKILQHLEILKKWNLRHAEHHAKNRTSLCGLDQETLFFDLPLIFFFFCPFFFPPLVIFPFFNFIHSIFPSFHFSYFPSFLPSIIVNVHCRQNWMFMYSRKERQTDRRAWNQCKKAYFWKAHITLEQARVGKKMHP